MPNPALTVGGTPLYPSGGLLDQSRPVYRPNYGNAGLLSEPDMGNLVQDFAGGLLSGYQVGATPDANGRYFTPISPSGTYTTDPGQSTGVQATEDPSSGITFRDAIQFRYGPGDLYGNNQSIFLGNLLTNDAFRKNVEKQWGATLDSAYDPSSEFWKYLQEHLGKMSGGWQGGGENQGGGQGTEGPGPGAGSGGAP